MGEKSGYFIFGLLDVVQITCTKNVSNEVTADPRNDLLSKCCTIKRRVLCVVAELFPLRVAKSAVQVAILISLVFPSSLISGWSCQCMSRLHYRSRTCPY